MDCPNCGAGASGKFCANCGGALPAEPDVVEELVEAEVANAHASELYAEAEVERASHATDADVELREAEVAEVAVVADAEVTLAAVEGLADVAATAVEALADQAPPAPADPPEGELAELGAEELEHHEHEHEAMDDGPPQPEDGDHGADHVEPITLLAPATAGRGRTTTTRSSAWRRHRR